MNEDLKQKIKEQMEFLSKELQDAIYSLDWLALVEEIRKKYLLSEDDIDNLKTETLLVLTGYEEGEAYARNIENEVGTSKEEAEKITDEMEQKIFTPIYNALTENIKKGVKVQNADAEQNIDFILSG